MEGCDRRRRNRERKKGEYMRHDERQREIRRMRNALRFTDTQK